MPVLGDAREALTERLVSAFHRLCDSATAEQASFVAHRWLPKYTAACEQAEKVVLVTTVNLKDGRTKEPLPVRLEIYEHG